MAVKLRLARHGRKGRPYYYIVVADSRSPRDGRFIERIGSYNPMTNPATIELDFDRALTWLNNGAIPTDTTRSILSYKGVLMKKHLLDGVKKGAFDEATAEIRFKKWLEEKEQKVRNKVSDLELAQRAKTKAAIAKETEVKEKRAAEVAKKRLAELEALKAEEEVAAETITEKTKENPENTETVAAE